MMKATFLVVLCYAMLIVGCGPTIRVQSDYDKDVNISGSKHYSWLSEEAIEEKGVNPLYYNELTDKRVRQAVDKQLKAKGFILSDTAKRLVLHYHIVVEEKAASLPNVVPHFYTDYWLKQNASVYPYKQGTLIIDLMDNTNNALVWRGWATGVIEDVVNGNPEGAINLAVQKIFTRFPFSR